MGDPALSEDSQKKPAKGWLGDRPGRSILRISAALLGIALAGTALATIWPKPDPDGADVQSSEGPLALAPLPEQAVMVLVVGLDADTLNAPSNNAAPQGPANADSLMLVNISTKQPVQILQLPTELAVQLPGIEEMQALSKTWQHGGIALTSDVVGELIDLPTNKPDRYLVLSRQSLRIAKKRLCGPAMGQSANSSSKATETAYAIDCDCSCPSSYTMAPGSNRRSSSLSAPSSSYPSHHPRRPCRAQAPPPF